MEKETDYTKLPLKDRCIHKSWKARVHAYEECVKKFRCIDDEKSPEWNKYLGLVKKFVTDSHATAQEKGLEATLAFIENAACAGKTVGEIMSGIVAKCIASPKTKTKDLAVQIILMFIEIEKQEAVQEELTKGTEATNPKIVSACIAALTLGVKEFGPKVIDIKPLMEKIPRFLEHSNKTIRDEGKAMIVEIYRWIGVPLKQQLSSLKAVILSELEIEFAKLNNRKAAPTRYLRSQMPKVTWTTDITSSGGDGLNNNEDYDNDDDPAALDIDPYDLIDPVDILSKLPNNFFDKLEAKKWQERKEALEALETLMKNPKLENGDYSDVVRALNKIIRKDSNVVVVALAGKCLTGLAGGLKKRFQTYASACLPAILEKFREKKPSVVNTLREAADAVFLSINIEVILEDAVAALENKNPAVKLETAAFLSRCFARTPRATLNKKLLKAYTRALLKTLNEPDPMVRDNSAEALGTALKLVGEKAMLPFLIDLDPLKMVKIKECSEKAIIHVKPTGQRETEHRLSVAPAKMGAINGSSKKSTMKGAASLKRHTITANERPTTMRDNDGAEDYGKKLSQATKIIEFERNLSSKEVDELASQILPFDVLNSLTDANSKTRLVAVEQLAEKIIQIQQENNTENRVNSQAIVRTLGKKPGFKDANFEVAKYRLAIVKMLAESFPFSSTTAEYCITDITEKLIDDKNNDVAADTLTAIAGVTSFEFVANEATDFAFNQKNPKLQQETLQWVANAIVEFGWTLNVKSLMEIVKKASTTTNPAVRTQAISLLGTLYIYVGRSLLMFCKNDKPALKQRIEQEYEKRSDETLAPPRRVPGQKATEKSTTSGIKRKSGRATSEPGSVREKEVEFAKTSGCPLLLVNNLKHQRLIDEQKLKIIKWNFTTPREEFVDLLKELMNSAGINIILIANMFHADFHYHLKAIDALTKDLQDNGSKSLVSNLDLILKWLTLRFFDTNPAVTLKSFEYLQMVFDRLSEDEYFMLDNEAASFIPYLITKFDDPEETVRMGVRSLFRLLPLIYPVSKLFPYVMEGLKSENAQQRTECLNQIGLFIGNFGTDVCEPSPSAALCEVAKQIADPDNSVRDAALNCIVAGYLVEGEFIFKLIGQIPDKDLSLLEESIKKATNNRSLKFASPSSIAEPTAIAAAPAIVEDADSDYHLVKAAVNLQDNKVIEASQPTDITADNPGDTVILIDDNANHDNTKMHTSPTMRAMISAPVHLDMESLKRIEEIPSVKIPDLVEDTGDPNEGINTLKPPAAAVASFIPSKLIVSKTGLLSPASTPTTKEDRLEQTILSMASRDLPIAIQSMITMKDLLQADQVSMIQTKEDKFINSITIQFKLLQTYPFNDDQVIRGFRRAFIVTRSFYETEVLGKNVPTMHLQELVHQMIILLAGDKFNHLDPAYSVIMNKIVIDIINHSNHTTIICVLIKLLHGCAESNESPKYEKLLIKCFWKIVNDIPGWAGELDYDAILLEVHHFLKDYPTAWWKNRDRDASLRTIKSLLHIMTKVKGRAILSHMTKINDIQESELNSCLNYLIAFLLSVESSSSSLS